MFVKTLQSCQPKDFEEWCEVLDTVTEAKNSLLRQDGYSPYQHVFGRDPNIASDLLQSTLDVVATTAPLFEPSAERASAIKLAARTSLLQLQDDRSLRLALAARPRALRQFAFFFSFSPPSPTSEPPASA